jgi:hypothetical protein
LVRSKRWEKSEESGVDAVGYLSKVTRVVFEVKGVLDNCHDTALIVVAKEVVVQAVEILKIVKLNGLLVVAASPLYVTDEMRYGSPEVNHEVGQSDCLKHLLEKVDTGVIVALTETPCLVVVLHEDIDAFEDGTVLDNSMVGLLNGNEVAQPFLEEINFQIECPAADIAVIVFKIWVMVNSLEARFPSVMACEHASKC